MFIPESDMFTQNPTFADFFLFFLTDVFTTITLETLFPLNLTLKLGHLLLSRFSDSVYKQASIGRFWK